MGKGQLEKLRTSGFVSVVGRPNAGKSTLLNSLISMPLVMVSKKANATRKRMNIIVPFENENYDSQVIFIDTPGLHESNKLLNEYMIAEASKAIGDSDLCVFVSVASTNKKEVEYYAQFLEQYDKKHILLLNKVDMLTQAELLECLKRYEQYQQHYLCLIPIRAVSLSDSDRNCLLLALAKYLPEHPHYYDNEVVSTTLMKDIYKEAIREAIFERFSDEIPYESDVKVIKMTEKPNVLVIKAQVIVAKDSQKFMIIGKNGATIKSLGSIARMKCENLAEKKVFLELYVKTVKAWNKDKKGLKQIGYDFDM